jgi:hypothetical protein
MTFSIMTSGMMVFNINSISIKTFSITTLSIATFSMMIFITKSINIKTLSITLIIMILSLKTISRTTKL